MPPLFMERDMGSLSWSSSNEHDRERIAYSKGLLEVSISYDGDIASQSALLSVGEWVPQQDESKLYTITAEIRIPMQALECFAKAIERMRGMSETRSLS